MKRWTRRPGEAPPPATAGTGTVTGTGGAGARTGFLVEEYDRVVLLRQPSDELLGPTEIADLVRCVEADDPGMVTLVAGADQESATELWPRLGALLDQLSDEGFTTVRLVMSGSGDDRPGDRSALARRIADAWQLDVLAPDGTVVCVPGGGLFVHHPGDPDADGHSGTEPGKTRARPRTTTGRKPARTAAPPTPADRGWWHFRPGAAPVPLGPRQPAPGWQPGPGRLPSRTRGGSVVQEIPAGVLIRPGGVRAPAPDDLCYAVPIDAQGPLLVLGVPDGDDLPAEDLADVVTTLPEKARSALRLAPGGRRDALPAGRSAAELVGSDVVVYSGLPLLTGTDAAGTETVRSVLLGADGAPRWQPYVDAVLCPPGADEPRLLRWSPPLPGSGDLDHGVIQLSEHWQVTVSRAGLLVGRRDATPPPATRPVDAEGPAIEVGSPGEALDDSLYPALTRLLKALPSETRTRARLHVHGKAEDGGRELRRLATDHALRSVRFGGFGRPAATAAPTPATPYGLPAPAPAPVPAPAPAPIPTASGPVARSESAPDTPAPTAASPVRPLEAEEPAAPRPVPTTTTGSMPPRSADSLGRQPAAPAPTTSAPGIPTTHTATATAAGQATATGASSPRPGLRHTPPPASPPTSPRPPSTPLLTTTPPATTPPSIPAPPSSAVAPVPERQSTDAERTAFLLLAEEVWEGHSATVARTLTRLPALRDAEEVAVRTDLVALLLYLGVADGPMGHRELDRELRAGGERLLPYAACLSSALHRLPSFQGPALRGARPAAASEPPRPGTVLRDPAAVTALPVGGVDGPGPAQAAYAIWSVTGRRIPAVPDAAGAPTAPDEILFPPGSAFRVLDVRTDRPTPLVLLRQLPPTAMPPASDDHAGLDDEDRAVLARLDEALHPDPTTPAPSALVWPDRCVGPLGTPGPPAG
ncbi:hypothetical protein [Streptomyces lichenis]|uniref:hypothetical protein n=1 Tax=Streptomyces lichenis TaxID=2306967 RepID=UPI0024A768FF|nr:hypothetical protein [Streptomyces lichenis]